MFHWTPAPGHQQDGTHSSIISWSLEITKRTIPIYQTVWHFTFGWIFAAKFLLSCRGPSVSSASWCIHGPSLGSNFMFRFGFDAWIFLSFGLFSKDFTAIFCTSICGQSSYGSACKLGDLQSCSMVLASWLLHCSNFIERSFRLGSFGMYHWFSSTISDLNSTMEQNNEKCEQFWTIASFKSRNLSSLSPEP